MKITPEILAEIERMVAREKEQCTNENGEVNYAYLSGMFQGLFAAVKHFDTVEEWFKLAIK